MSSKNNNKWKYGEVFTPKGLVHEIWSLFRHKIYNDHVNTLTPLTIFEPCAGKAVFYDVFFDVFQKEEYSKYIMNEINEHDHSEDIHTILEKHNPCQRDKIIFKDIFHINENDIGKDPFDVVIGNLPFNINGMKQVPSSKYDVDKHLAGNSQGNMGYKEGKTIWADMVRFLISHNSLLKNNGYAIFIIPLIWLKPDKSGIYLLLTHVCRVLYLKTYTSTEANKAFGYNAQTPLCYVIVQKTNKALLPHYPISVFDRDLSEFVSFDFTTNKGQCIPTNHINSVQQMIQWRQISNSSHSLAKHLIKICHMNKKVVDGAVCEPNLLLDPQNLDIVHEKLNPMSKSEKKEYFVVTGAQVKEREKGTPVIYY